MKRYIESRCLFLAVAFALTVTMSGILIAADANVPSSVKKEVLTPLEEQMNVKIDVAFIETDIETAVRSIAQKANLNVVLSPNVTGTVTATLSNVPLREALSNILRANGYGYTVDKNIIRVAPLEELGKQEERLVSRIYRITYADVAQVEKALGKFISQRGSISANPGTSNVIVTDTESKIKAIDTFIEEVDRITPQILVEARVYDITSRDTLDLGIEWQAGRETTLSTTLGSNPSGQTKPFATGTFSADTAKTATDYTGNLRIGWLGGGVDIDAIIKAKEEIADAKLLANPRILVLDNEAAMFDIVREIPYSEASFTSTTVTETIKFKNVGVKLAVTPHVTRDGMIRLNLAPEFSVVVRTESFSTSNVPVVDTRKVNTIALVKDGQTVVIGGLRKKDVTKQINKVPFLGDIPLLGALFRFEGEETTVNELVVFITPKIVKPPIIMSPSETRAYQKTEFEGPTYNYTRAEKKSKQQ